MLSAKEREIRYRRECIIALKTNQPMPHRIGDEEPRRKGSVMDDLELYGGTMPKVRRTFIAGQDD